MPKPVLPVGRSPGRRAPAARARRRRDRGGDGRHGPPRRAGRGGVGEGAPSGRRFAASASQRPTAPRTLSFLRSPWASSPRTSSAPPTPSSAAATSLGSSTSSWGAAGAIAVRRSRPQADADRRRDGFVVRVARAGVGGAGASGRARRCGPFGAGRARAALPRREEPYELGNAFQRAIDDGSRSSRHPGRPDARLDTAARPVEGELSLPQGDHMSDHLRPLPAGPHPPSQAACPRRRPWRSRRRSGSSRTRPRSGRRSASPTSGYGRWKEAEAEFRAMLELSPADDYAHYGLGRRAREAGPRPRGERPLQAGALVATGQQGVRGADPRPGRPRGAGGLARPWGGDPPCNSVPAPGIRLVHVGAASQRSIPTAATRSSRPARTARPSSVRR